jgi:uncharacterized protein (UPF0218 family)
MIFIVENHNNTTMKRPFIEDESMISIEKDIFLPESLRDELKKPFGKLMECSDIAKMFKGKDITLVTIGDFVSKSLIKGGLSPNLIIWDGKNKRLPVEDLSTLRDYAPITKVSNSAASISKEAWDVVSESLNKEKESILVDGEEDLLAIPVILNSNEGTYVVYGMPPEEGAILIDIDPKIKSVFQDLLSKFD